jgi:hypothetical protein
LVQGLQQQIEPECFARCLARIVQPVLGKTREVSLHFNLAMAVAADDLCEVAIAMFADRVI